MTHEERNIGDRAEHPGSDEQKISELLGGLKRVEAPKDFDFHLKARIANARPGDYQKASLFPILKYAMPMALFLVVGAGIMVNSSLTNWSAPDTVLVPQQEQQSLLPQQSDDTLMANAPRPADPVLPTASPEVLPVDNGTVVQRPERQLAVHPTSETRGGRTVSNPVAPAPITPREGSVDFGGGNPSATPIIPKEFRPSNTNSSSNSTNISSDVPKEMAAKPLAVRDALESIGVEADLEGNTWKVRSVKGGGIAGQMGLEPGDKIESIDGKAIDEKTVYKDGSFRVKTIRVRRGTTAVDLPKEN